MEDASLGATVSVVLLGTGYLDSGIPDDHLCDSTSLGLGFLSGKWGGDALEGCCDMLTVMSSILPTPS